MLGAQRSQEREQPAGRCHRPFAVKSLTSRRAVSIALLPANLALEAGVKAGARSRPRQVWEPSDMAQQREKARGCGAGGWSILESPQLLGWSFSSSLQPPAPGSSLGALLIRSTLGQGACGETEARSTPVTKPQVITKYPVGPWNRRPQKLPGDGPTRQGVVSPLPAAPEDALERVLAAECAGLCNRAAASAHSPGPGAAQHPLLRPPVYPPGPADWLPARGICATAR